MQLPYAGDNGRPEGDEGNHVAGVLDETEDDAADVELPPPMKPIQVTYCILPLYYLESVHSGDQEFVSL